MCAESVESLPYPIYANRSAHVNDSNLLIIAQTRASPAALLQPRVFQADAWTASFRGELKFNVPAKRRGQ